MLNGIGVIVHENNTYYKANKKSYDKVIDEKIEYTKCLGFKITEKEKTLPILHWIHKMHKNPTGPRFNIRLKNALRNKFLSLFPMSLRSYTLKFFIKILTLIIF